MLAKLTADIRDSLLFWLSEADVWQTHRSALPATQHANRSRVSHKPAFLLCRWQACRQGLFYSSVSVQEADAHVSKAGGTPPVTWQNSQVLSRRADINVSTTGFKCSSVAKDKYYLFTHANVFLEWFQWLMKMQAYRWCFFSVSGKCEILYLR